MLRACVPCEKESVIATKGRPSIVKRQKEQARLEQRRRKEDKRAQRNEEKENRPAGNPGEDPDIAGIIPGPQPILE